MSQEQPIPGHAVPARRQLPIRWDQLKRAPVLTMVGLPELIGLAAAGVLALITVFAYVYFFVPSHSRQRGAELERDLLLQQVRVTQKDFQENNTTHATVDKITASLEDFESNWLASSNSGRMSLYSTLNNLIRSNGLRNTAGPSYSPLDALGTKPQIQPTATAEKQSVAKWQTIYPGIAVSVTVEGPYQSIWHFVRDIETSRQFLIINAIELEGVTQTNSAIGTSEEVPGEGVPVVTRQGKPGTAAVPAARGRGALVSLRLDLATYFRGANENKANP